MSFLPAIEYLTGSPELAVAETAYVPPTTASTGALVLNSIVCTLSAGVAGGADGAAGSATGTGAPARGAEGAGTAGGGAAHGVAAGKGSGCAAPAEDAAASPGATGSGAAASSPAMSSPRDDCGRHGAARPSGRACANGRRREQALGVGEPKRGGRGAGALLRRAVAAVVDPQHGALQRDRDPVVGEPVEAGEQLETRRGDPGPERAGGDSTDDLSHRRPETAKPPCSGPLLYRGLCRCRHVSLLPQGNVLLRIARSAYAPLPLWGTRHPPDASLDRGKAEPQRHVEG